MRRYEDYAILESEIKSDADRILLARELKDDLYFLVRFILSTRVQKDELGDLVARHRFVYDFCRALEENHHNVCDIGARFHWKSTLKTFALAIHYMIQSPNISMSIFSARKALARMHLRRVKTELEMNTLLIRSFPQVFYGNPKISSPLWSLDDGIVIRRGGINRHEATLEACSLTEGFPTGKHYDVGIYDDAIDRDSVRTEAARDYIDEQWSLSLNLMTENPTIVMHGSYYHIDDLYHRVEKRGITMRKWSCVDDSKPAPEGFEQLGGAPVFLAPEDLAKKRKAMGSKVFAMQMCCDDSGLVMPSFDLRKVMRYKRIPKREASGKNVYIVIDPAKGKKRSWSKTAVVAIAVGADKNFYLVDGIKDDMNPRERITTVINFHKKWSRVSRVIDVIWEENALEDDKFHAEETMERIGYRFPIRTVSHRKDKHGRIFAFFQPVVEDRRLYLPRDHTVRLKDGTNYSFVEDLLLNEMTHFPNTKDDHLLDAIAMLAKLPYISWPNANQRVVVEHRRGSAHEPEEFPGSWMVA